MPGRFIKQRAEFGVRFHCGERVQHLADGLVARGPAGQIGEDGVSLAEWQASRSSTTSGTANGRSRR
ncbi:hypothetical protein ACIRG5_26830 [Lentzea sp. NPDC102401]|uniref:hypothetical protein n=1 Tax=Lentzea sp. NPDC102401 TaxID=3364128 RepID=UPI003800CAA4